LKSQAATAKLQAYLIFSNWKLERLDINALPVVVFKAYQATYSYIFWLLLTFGHI